MTPAEQERFQLLLVKAIDREMNHEEQAEFERLIHTYPACQKEWRAHKQMKEVTATMTFKTPTLEVWDSYWTHVYNRLERSLGWILVSLGAIILLTFGAFQAVESMLADQEMPAIVKIGTLLLLGGAVVLFVSVLREKLFTQKSDPYQEVER